MKNLFSNVIDKIKISPDGEAYGTLKDIEETIEENNEVVKEEEWIWVEGYKGTDKDMKCHNDYQFRLNEQFDIPEGEEIKECENGFHLCLNLGDVFDHYEFKNNNRFFRVKALVRKEDVKKYGTYDRTLPLSFKYFSYSINSMINKIVAKSIIFTEEVSLDELCESLNISSWDDEYKTMARSIGIRETRAVLNVKKLTELGYSEAFAKLVIDKNLYNTAYAVGTQEGLSMDMKVWAIFNCYTITTRQNSKRQR